MIRKNISLHEEDMKKIAKIVEQQEGNLSAAIREIIDFVDFMLRKFGSLEEARKVERRAKGVCLPHGLLNWFLRYTEACLPDESAVESIEEIREIDTISDLIEVVDMGFPVELNITPEAERDPGEVEIHLTGEKMYAEFVAKVIACFLGESRGMKVEDLSRHGASITLRMRRVGVGSRDRESDYRTVRKSLLKYFGARHVMMQEILDKPRFWNDMINATADWGDVQRYKYPRLYR